MIHVSDIKCGESAENMVLLLANIRTRTVGEEGHLLVSSMLFVRIGVIFSCTSSSSSTHCCTTAYGVNKYGGNLMVCGCYFQVDTVNELWRKTFGNYKSWCQYLHVNSSIMYVV